MTNIISIVQQKLIKLGLWLTAGLILATTTICSSPALAVSPINPNLEEQVLQIIRTHPEVIIEAAQLYQQQQLQKRQEAQKKSLQVFKTNPEALIGDSPTRGTTEHKILLVEFSDFQCPYCAKVSQTVKQFMTKHQDEVTLVYKHLPLASIHSQAIPAAQAAWAAGKQGKFWEYHDSLFAQRENLSEELYLDIAQSLKLNLEKFNLDRNGEAVAKDIQTDISLAQTLNLNGTPSFIMSDEVFSGAIELSDLESILERVRNS
ncbi:MAG: thioredoxin domain-containing protein [Symploca sp. SIO1C4]|uniref:Thioredoxin domain-containing protein n=1 Tax=Symploca sp. SIO1C4 TaxID=2607765 RepID=A0A6B3NHW4_9CYAN|nr:thioredoxin domain-containing protein [Symploca sp. SIO1C4]NET05744.1 thioredoxin domain-containing protein [Symploca sp. SIO2B6]